MDKVFFAFGDILTDTITHINGQALPAPILAKDLAYDNLGVWWIEQDIRGVNVLCTNHANLTNLYLTVEDSTDTYDIQASSIWIGNRPIIVHPPHAPH